VTHIFKKRVEFDTREACNSGIVLCVSRVTDRLHLLGFRRFWECVSSRGVRATYAGIRSIVDDRGDLERRPKPSSRGVPAARGEGTLDRDYSQPIARKYLLFILKTLTH